MALYGVTRPQWVNVVAVNVGAVLALISLRHGSHFIKACWAQNSNFVKIDILVHFCWMKNTLQWRHNGHDSISNRQPRECLLSRLIGLRSKKTSKLAFVRGIHLRPGNSPHKGPGTRKMFPFDEVIMMIRSGCSFLHAMRAGLLGHVHFCNLGPLFP